MTSEYLLSLSAFNHQFITNEQDAIKTALAFLDTAKLTPTDIDVTKTNTQNSPVDYYTFPHLYSIQTGNQSNSLIETTSLSKAQVIRVNLYQKDVEYDLNTGKSGGEANIKVHEKMPILYPNTPYSTMEFWITSDPGKAVVGEAHYIHQDVDLSDSSGTYNVISPQEAYDELSNTDLTKRKAYIAAYNGSDNNILIKDVYFAYYLGDEPEKYSQKYLMPIYVFEGSNGFFAYVSAVRDDQLAK